MVRFRGLKNKWLLALVVLVLLAGVVTALELTNVTHIFHKKKPTVPVATGSTFNGKGEKKTPSSSSTSGTTSVPPNTSPKSSGSSAVLLTPSGNFVSDHHPNLSGYPAPNTMSSVCNTTPGATCQITFTQNGVTKSLPQQTADPTGFTNWNWKLQDIGLTTGTWKIEAIATLNGQTKTAFDAMDLVVSP